jgi:hypothetical protein
MDFATSWKGGRVQHSDSGDISDNREVWLGGQTLVFALEAL